MLMLKVRDAKCLSCETWRNCTGTVPAAAVDCIEQSTSFEEGHQCFSFNDAEALARQEHTVKQMMMFKGMYSLLQKAPAYRA